MWSTRARLRIIAGKIDGNITHGLNAIKAAAIKADSEGKQAIDEADIIIEEDCPADDVCPEQRIILEVMAEQKSLPAGQLYQQYIEKVKYPKGERAFRNYVHELCARGLLKAVGDKKGRIYEFVEPEAAQPS